MVFPYDLEETYGKGNLVPVVATFDGIEVSGQHREDGDGPLLLIRKEIRLRLGKGVGDEVLVAVTLDSSRREVEVPADLETALNGHPKSREKFEKLSYSHRREYVEWIDGAKREETSAARIAKAVELLAEGKPLK